MRFGDLTPAEHDVLAKYAALPGHHVDIGTNSGGSACTAALAKPEPWLVYTIDPYPKMNGTTLAERGLEKRVIQIIGPSQLWIPVPGITTGLIDGDHFGIAVLADLQMLEQAGANTILFHDYDHKDIQAIVELATKTGWELVEVVDKLAVIQRVTN